MNRLFKQKNILVLSLLFCIFFQIFANTSIFVDLFTLENWKFFILIKIISILLIAIIAILLVIIYSIKNLKIYYSKVYLFISFAIISTILLFTLNIIFFIVPDLINNTLKYNGKCDLFLDSTRYGFFYKLNLIDDHNQSLFINSNNFEKLKGGRELDKTDFSYRCKYDVEIEYLKNEGITLNTKIKFQT